MAAGTGAAAGAAAARKFPAAGVGGGLAAGAFLEKQRKKPFISRVRNSTEIGPLG